MCMRDRYNIMQFIFYNLLWLSTTLEPVSINLFSGFLLLRWEILDHEESYEQPPRATPKTPEFGPFGLFNELPLYSPNQSLHPVSYTHLDVYKRQFITFEKGFSRYWKSD